MLDDQRLIDEAHLGAAWTFWRYCADSIRWAFPPDEARLTAPPGSSPFAAKRANKLLAALRAHPEGMTRTQISAVFAGNLAQERIEEALYLLRKSESAVEKPVDGSKIPRWFSAENAKDENDEKH